MQADDRTRLLLLRAQLEAALRVGRAVRADGSMGTALVGREGYQHARQRLACPRQNATDLAQLRLRRAYLAVVAAPHADVRHDEARAFATWLRTPGTQAFIADYGRGKYDGEPLFFPVVVERAR